MKRIRASWLKFKGPEGDHIKWRFVLIAFLILAVSVSWAFRVNAVQNDQINKASIETDLKQCDTGNKSRKDVTDTLLYIGKRLDEIQGGHDTTDFVQDVIDKKLQPKNCDDLVQEQKSAG